MKNMNCESKDDSKTMFNELTLESINTLDVSDAIDICSSMDIPLDGLYSVEEFRERIHFYFVKNEQENKKKKVNSITK